MKTGIATAYAAEPLACGAAETFDTLAAESYRWNRRLGVRPAGALFMARKDAAEGKRRYQEGGPIGPVFDYDGERCRWVERPEACGLRFVGYADELNPGIGHKGWYTTPDGWTGEVNRGVVYQLPAHKGRERFVYGHADSNNEGAAVLAFGDMVEASAPHDGYNVEDSDALRDAATWSDGFAERTAEAERNYQAGWGAGNRANECETEAGDIRRALLAFLRECREACPALDGFDSIRATLRERVESDLADIWKLREERDALRNGEVFNDCYGYTDLAHYNDGFAEGYGG